MTLVFRLARLALVSIAWGFMHLDLVKAVVCIVVSDTYGFLNDDRLTRRFKKKKNYSIVVDETTDTMCRQNNFVVFDYLLFL